MRSSFAEHTDLYFYVADSQIEFLEPLSFTWSEHVERRARRRVPRARA